MDIADRIKRRRKELGLSADQVAEAIGVSRANYYRYESSDVGKLPSNVLIPLARVLRCTPSYLIGWDENVSVPLPHEEPVRDILIYGALSCGTGLFVEDEVIGHVSVPLAMLPSRSAEYFAQYASGDSMEGVGIYDGDLLVFEKTAALDNGQIGCFCIDENVATCKKFSRIGGSVMLMPANDKYQPIIISPENECFRILGRQVLRMGK